MGAPVLARTDGVVVARTSGVAVTVDCADDCCGDPPPGDCSCVDGALKSALEIDGSAGTPCGVSFDYTFGVGEHCCGIVWKAIALGMLEGAGQTVATNLAGDGQQETFSQNASVNVSGEVTIAEPDLTPVITNPDVIASGGCEVYDNVGGKIVKGFAPLVHSGIVFGLLCPRPIVTATEFTPARPAAGLMHGAEGLAGYLTQFGWDIPPGFASLSSLDSYADQAIGWPNTTFACGAIDTWDVTHGVEYDSQPGSLVVSTSSSIEQVTTPGATTRVETANLSIVASITTVPFGYCNGATGLAGEIDDLVVAFGKATTTSEALDVIGRLRRARRRALRQITRGEPANIAAIERQMAEGQCFGCGE